MFFQENPFRTIIPIFPFLSFANRIDSRIIPDDSKKGMNAKRNKPNWRRKKIVGRDIFSKFIVMMPVVKKGYFLGQDGWIYVFFADFFLISPSPSQYCSITVVAASAVGVAWEISNYFKKTSKIRVYMIFL